MNTCPSWKKMFILWFCFPLFYFNWTVPITELQPQVRDLLKIISDSLSWPKIYFCFKEGHSSPKYLTVSSKQHFSSCVISFTTMVRSVLKSICGIKDAFYIFLEMKSSEVISYLSTLLKILGTELRFQLPASNYNVVAINSCWKNNLCKKTGHSWGLASIIVYASEII